jgi:hypothetical protein
MIFAATYAATWEGWKVLQRNIEKRQIHTGSVKDGLLLHHPVIPGDQGVFVPDAIGSGVSLVTNRTS